MEIGLGNFLAMRPGFKEPKPATGTHLFVYRQLQIPMFSQTCTLFHYGTTVVIFQYFGTEV